MSDLARYLAPTHGARPNPGHVVEWRHGEAGPWYPLEPAARGMTERQTEDLVASPPVALVQGDLVRVLDTKGRVARFLVMTGEGLVYLPAANARFLSVGMYDPGMRAWYRGCGHDWERAWEGCNHPDRLLYLAGLLGVDRSLLVLVACDCAETALPYVPHGEDRPRQAIEAARRWTQGEATEQEVNATARPSFGLGSFSGEAAAHAAWTATQSSPVRAASNAVSSAVMASTRGAVGPHAWNAAIDASHASLAVLVRRRIPLWRVALALAANAPE